MVSLTVPETTKHPCATCDDGLANKPGGICGQCFMDGKIAPSDDGAFDDPLEPAVSDSPNGSVDVPPAVFCRIADCDEIATHHIGARGVYANTCDTHYAAAVSRAKGKATRKPKKAKVTRNPRQPMAPTQKPAHGGLVAAAERVEAAQQAMKAARDELAAALAELLELVESEQTA